MSRSSVPNSTRSPNSSRTWSSLPHRGGGCAPGGGGGAYGPIVRNSAPIMPSGVQLSSPIVPPGRQTRTISSADSWWCGANITPIEDITTSNDSSSNGRFSASASTQSSSRPTACARARPASSSSGVEIAGGDVRAGLGGGERCVARARGDVEHLHARADPGRLDEPGPEWQQERLDHGRVVAGCPHRAVARLELGVGCGRQGASPSVVDAGTVSPAQRRCARPRSARATTRYVAS